MLKIKLFIVTACLGAFSACAGDADIQLPLLDQVSFVHGTVTSRMILFLACSWAAQ